MSNDVILNEDTIQVATITDPFDFEKDLKYEKISDPDIAAGIAGFVHGIPAMIGSETLSKAYFVDFPKGVSGYLAESKHGGLIPTIKDYSTGQFKGQATLHPANGAAVAASAFAVLSVVTCQYYLNQINSKLSDIEKKISAVLEFLYTDKACEIYACVETVKDLYMNYKSIIATDHQKTASIATLQQMKIIAEKNIQFYYKDMGRISNEFNDKSPSKQKEMMEELRNDLSSYNQALSLYGMCSVLEIIFSNNLDKGYVESVEQSLAAHNNTNNILISKLDGMIQAGLHKKLKSEKLPLLDEIQNLLKEETPLKEFEYVVNKMSDDISTNTRFAVLENGEVYKMAK